MNEIELLKKRIDELERIIRSLEASHSIPLKIDQAFRARFVSSSLIDTSSKSNSSESIGIDEAGSATHTVLGQPDAFLQIQVKGTTYYLPVFT